MGGISPPPSPQISSSFQDEDLFIVVDIPDDDSVAPVTSIQGEGSASSDVIVDIPADYPVTQTAAGVQHGDPITPSSHTVLVISDDDSESSHSSDHPRGIREALSTISAINSLDPSLPWGIRAAIAAGPPDTTIPPPLPDYVCVCLYIYIINISFSL